MRELQPRIPAHADVQSARRSMPSDMWFVSRVSNIVLVLLWRKRNTASRRPWRRCAITHCRHRHRRQTICFLKVSRERSAAAAVNRSDLVTLTIPFGFETTPSCCSVFILRAMNSGYASTQRRSMGRARPHPAIALSRIVRYGRAGRGTTCRLRDTRHTSCAQRDPETRPAPSEVTC